MDGESDTCGVCGQKVPKGQLMSHNFSKHKLLFIGLPLVIIVILIAVVGLFFTRQKSPNTVATPTTTTPPKTATSSSATAQPAAETPPAQSQPMVATQPQAPQSVTVTYDGNGFSPASVTVASGGTITFKNTSSATVQVDSNPHPIHTDNTELNIGPIDPGQSKTATLTTKGTWGYHNHLDPSQTGTVIVQ